MFQMKKVLAGLTSTILTVAACAAISVPSYAAEVYTPTVTVPGTSFQYNLSVEYLHAGDLMNGSVAAQEGDIAVTFHSIQNADFQNLVFLLYYDTGYDVITDYTNSPIEKLDAPKWTNSGGFINTHLSDTSNIIQFYVAHKNGNYGSGNGNVTYFFRPNQQYVKGESGFTLALTEYRGKDGSHSTGSTPASIEIPGIIPYILGDVDNDQKIELEDATDVLTVADSAPNTTVSYLNNHLSEWLPNAVCAEVADVDFDQHITEADAQSILNYYSQSATSTPIDSLIGKTYLYIVKA